MIVGVVCNGVGGRMEYAVDGSVEEVVASTALAWGHAGIWVVVRKEGEHTILEGYKGKKKTGRCEISVINDHISLSIGK